MTLPRNKIKKIKLSNNTEYDIVPTIIQDGSTEYSATLPTLTKDEIIATTSDLTEIVDLTDLEHAFYKLRLYEESGVTYFRIDFSQGYVLYDIQMRDIVNDDSFYVLMDTSEIPEDYYVNDYGDCLVSEYDMTNKTTGGLANYMIIEITGFTPTQLSDLEVVNLHFTKVEGTFEFNYEL